MDDAGKAALKDLIERMHALAYSQVWNVSQLSDPKWDPIREKARSTLDILDAAAKR